MKIIHGEDQVTSRRQLIQLKSEAKQKNDQLAELDGQNLTLTELINISGTDSLFGGSMHIFIEQLFSRRPGKEKDQIVDYLKKHLDLPIVIWEGKDVSDQLKTFPSQYIVKSDLPKYVFQFLDALSLPLLQKTLANVSPEQIMALLVRQMHNLIMVKTGQTSLPSWQVSKLKPLSAKFSLPLLLSQYSKLLDMDFHHKTSSSSMDLSGNLQIWLIEMNNKA